MFNLLRIADIWKRTPVENPTDRIERALLDRSRRLIAGVAIDSRFKRVTGSLVVARGRGKSTSVLFCDSVAEQIPSSLQQNCSELAASGQNMLEFESCISELADIQATVVARLKQKAAKYVDRILAISVSDPGWWRKDFDGAPIYRSFCDATRLAEETGVSVIEGWPAADIASGGNGTPLHALPIWLLQSDRNPRIARHVNVSLCVKDLTRGLLLPPSDGLDAGNPDIRPVSTQGMDLVDGIRKHTASESISDDEFDKLLVSGVQSRELAAAWNEETKDGDQLTKRMLDVIQLDQFSRLSTEQLLCTAMSWISEKIQIGIESALQGMQSERIHERSELERQLRSSRQLRISTHGLLEAFDASAPMLDHPGQIFLDAPKCSAGAFASILGNVFPKSIISTKWTSRLNLANTSDDVDGPSLLAAMLGYLHVDQVPANLPRFTNAQQQRILGRLTPGRPNSWRNLLREMADYEPPAMKLRDAV